MPRYHVNAKGEPGVCKAHQGNCPYGTVDEHYGSKEAARQAYEDAQSAVPELQSKNAEALTPGLVMKMASSFKTPADLATFDPSRETALATATNRYDTDEAVMVYNESKSYASPILRIDGQIQSTLLMAQEKELNYLRKNDANFHHTLERNYPAVAAYLDSLDEEAKKRPPLGEEPLTEEELEEAPADPAGAEGAPEEFKDHSFEDVVEVIEDHQHNEAEENEHRAWLQANRYNSSTGF